MSEQDRLLMVKAALAQTVNTQGWPIVKQIADNAIALASKAAIDEEDPEKGEILRYKAQALKNGFRDIFKAIEEAQQFGTEEEPSWFERLAFEDQEIRIN